MLLLTEADPAEVIITLLAVHVIAPSVLVDGDLALGAIFREFHQPRRGSAILLQPHW